MITGLLLSACTVDTGENGDGETGGGGDDTGSQPGDVDACAPMEDDAPCAPVKIVIKNERDVPIYYPAWGEHPTWNNCGGDGWSVDGEDLFGVLPMCGGLLAGEPGLPGCAPVYVELAPGATAELEWDQRATEVVPIVAECWSDPAFSYTTCGRSHVVEGGTHELETTFALGFDESTGIASDPWTVTVPFALPTAVVDVVID
ncbi:hypothetical protein WMF31_21840 [Sorangium sp. So ce1036]|uniref:hypothetical protein n=1 Tax=Sorangium sp. So ce1036 TaxID=3133328 RepID=UPI003F0C47C2